ncbi:MAG: SEC-C domain-containing protein, partial [Verrucomicrobia bacterium]|nr:SEC-C domain-containing protein [Verrucomicrobiota bacterium]
AEKQKARSFIKNPEYDPDSIVNNAVRSIMIKTIDHYWQEHLLLMDHLRSDVHMRVVGQKDPLMEFKHEAFILFEKFTQHLKEQMAQAIFKFEIFPSQQFTPSSFVEELQWETSRSFASDLSDDDEEIAQPTGDREVEIPVAPIVVGPRTGRNDLCPCKSGKKYKKCCGTGPEE